MESNEVYDIEEEEMKNQLIWEVKIATAIGIITKSKHLLKSNKTQENLPLQVSLLTGIISSDDVTKYAGNRLAKTFSFWEKSQQLTSTTCTGRVTYEFLKHVLHHKYVIKRIIPTKQILLEYIQIMKDKKYTMELLDHDLKHFGFTWLKLPNTDKCILYERSDLLFERQRHLKTLIQYRKQGKNIIYLEERIYTDLYKYPQDTKEKENYIILASTSNGFYQKCYFNVGIREAFKDFFDTELACYSPENSVIVTAKKPYLDMKCPDEASTLEQMTEWLEENDCPVPSNSKRAHLYETIKLLLGNKPEYTMSQLETLLLGRGFKIVKYNPLHFSEMYEKNFFFETLGKILRKTTITKYIKNSMNAPKIETLNKKVNEEILQLNLHWQQTNDQIVIKEQIKAQEDVEIEIIVDQLLTMAKYKGLDQKDIEHLDTFEPNAESLLGNVIFL